MPLGTTPLQSPGWNEGKARYETLGKHGHKNKSSVGAALQREHLPYVSEVPPLWGSINELETNNPGLAPWAMQEYRPCRALRRLSTTINPFAILM